MMSKNFKETLCKNRKMEPLHTGYAFKDGLCASCYIEQQAEQIDRLEDALQSIMTYTRLGVGSVRRIRQVAGQALAAQPQGGE